MPALATIRHDRQRPAEIDLLAERGRLREGALAFDRGARGPFLPLAEARDVMRQHCRLVAFWPGVAHAT